MIFALSTILSPQLESHIGRTDQNLDIELGSVVLWFQIVPVSILPFHIRGVQH